MMHTRALLKMSHLAAVAPRSVPIASRLEGELHLYSLFETDLAGPLHLSVEREGTEMLLFSGGASLFSLCTFCVFNICIAATHWGHSRVYSVSTGTFSTRLTNRLYHAFRSGSFASAWANARVSKRIIATNSRGAWVFLSNSPER